MFKKLYSSNKKPGKFYAYMIKSMEGLPFYAGKGTGERWKTSFRRVKIRVAADFPKNKYTCKVAVKYFDTEIEALQQETTWILELAPKYNKNLSFVKLKECWYPSTNEECSRVALTGAGISLDVGRNFLLEECRKVYRGYALRIIHTGDNSYALLVTATRPGAETAAFYLTYNKDKRTLGVYSVVTGLVEPTVWASEYVDSPALAVDILQSSLIVCFAILGIKDFGIMDIKFSVGGKPYDINKEYDDVNYEVDVFPAFQRSPGKIYIG